MDPCQPGGHESYVRAHALAAQRIGFEPHLFCLAGRSATERTELGVIHRVAAPPRRPPPVLFQIPLPAQLPWLAYAAARFLARRGGPRLIHGFGIFAAAACASRTILRRRGIDSIPLASAYATRAYEIGVMQRGLGKHHGQMHRLRYRAWLGWVEGVDDAVEGWGYAQSQLVLVNYESVRSLLVRSYGSGLPVRRIPYCASTAFDEREPPRLGAAPDEVQRLQPADAPLIVCVSRHDPRKGIDRLLLALSELRDAGIPFRACVVGPGRLLEAHRRLAERLGLHDQVAQPGAVADSNRYLRAADIFVLPSLAESSGSVSVLEALQSAIPIVASACDGIPEDLTHGIDALLVEPGDSGALAAALGHLLTAPRLRVELASAARRTYETRFSSAGLVTALAEVYDELALAGVAAIEADRISLAT